MKKRLSNDRKELVTEYTQSLDKEVISYLNLKLTLKHCLDSPKFYWSDLQDMLKNLWIKEQLIISLTGTIYNKI